MRQLNCGPSRRLREQAARSRFSCAIALLLALGGCKSAGGPHSSSGIPTLTTSAQVTAGSTGTGLYTVRFGQVAVGQQLTLTVPLTNTGTSPLALLGGGAPSDAEFGATFSTGTSIGPGQSIGLPLVFTPFSRGSKSATLEMQTNSSTIPTLLLTLQGTGVDLKLMVAPSALDFGSVVVHTSATKTMTLTNNSELDLDITPSALQGTAADLFTTDQPNAFTLKKGTTVPFQATYSPLAPSASDQASLTLDLSVGNPVVVTLKGVAVESGLQITPNPLDFNFVQLGQQRSIPLHFQNIGNRDVNIGSIAVTASSQAFVLAAGAPQTADLRPGMGLDVGVTFTPVDARRYSGELEIQSSDNLGQQSVQLFGYGGGAAITCTPLTLDFGATPAGFTSTLPVICTNTGSDVLVGGQPDPEAELAFSRFAITGGNGAFVASLDPQSPQSPVPAGQSVRVDVTYTPAGNESDNATLTVVSNVTNPSTPPSIPLFGQGVSEKKCFYSLTPSSLDWGQVQPGGNVYPQAFTLTNVGPNECVVDGVHLLPGSDTPTFGMTDVVSQRLSPPGPGAPFPSSLTVPVSFSPRTAGNYSGAVGFTISDPDQPNVRVPLSGTGGSSCFVINPSSINFGVVGTSNGKLCNQEVREFTATNGCAQVVTITGITAATDMSASTFALVAGDVPPVTLQAGQTITPPFAVGFTPPATGSFFGSMLVQTDGQANPYGVFFQGSAIDGNTVTDRFTGSTARADILWVMDIDDDQTEQAAEAMQAQAFVDGLLASGIDFQIGVTSTALDGPCKGDQKTEDGQLLPCPGCHLEGHTPTIVTSLDPDAGADLAALMLVPPGGCEPDERMFESIYRAVVSGPGADYNGAFNFIRPGGYLAVITENEDFEDDNSEQNSPDWYASQFLTVKGSDHPELFSFSYINPSQFGDKGGHMPFNRTPERLAAMLELVGGVALDTTQPKWWQGLVDLWQIVLAHQKQFVLSGGPDPATIRLYLDGPPPDQVAPGQSPGQLLQPTNPNGTVNWQYSAPSNTIQVNSVSLVLQANDTLYAEYTLLCAH